jgi:hypothetical protein
MKTEKFMVGFAFIVLLAVSLTGCFSLFGTRPGVTTIDPNLPIEQSAVVAFQSSMHIKEYNGISTEKEWYPKDRLRKMTVTMPAGETHLLFDLYTSFSRGNTTYTFRPKDLELKFDFEAGKKYTVGVYASQNEGNFLFPKQKVVLAIWDKIYSDANPGNRQGKHIVKSWEIGEF